jgi:hypothetical protein
MGDEIIYYNMKERYSCASSNVIAYVGRSGKVLFILNCGTKIDILLASLSGCCMSMEIITQSHLFIHDAANEDIL